MNEITVAYSSDVKDGQPEWGYAMESVILSEFDFVDSLIMYDVKGKRIISPYGNLFKYLGVNDESLRLATLYANKILEKKIEEISRPRYVQVRGRGIRI